LAQIRPWFTPWRYPVHERLTSTGAAALGFPAADLERLVQGNLDNELCASPLGTLRRQSGNEYQPSHCLRKREHNGAGADHDSALDAGWERDGRPSVQYRGAEQASLAYLRLLQLAFASRDRAAVTDMLQAFCSDRFRLAA
jgi:hypothetical protein